MLHVSSWYKITGCIEGGLSAVIYEKIERAIAECSNKATATGSHADHGYFLRAIGIPKAAVRAAKYRRRIGPRLDFGIYRSHIQAHVRATCI